MAKLDFDKHALNKGEQNQKPNNISISLYPPLNNRCSQTKQQKRFKIQNSDDANLLNGHQTPSKEQDKATGDFTQLI